MRNSRKLLAALLALTLLAAACGSSDSESSDATTDGSTGSGEDEGQESTDGEEATGGEETSDEAVTLVLGSWRSDDQTQMDTILGAFNESHPGIEVSFEPTAAGEYNTGLRTALETGLGPDLFYVRSYAIGRQLYDEGFIEPLDDMNLAEIFGEAGVDPWTQDGVTFAEPYIAVSHGIYYNMDLFAEAGVAVPQTWDELISAAQTLDGAGVIPFANAAGDEWTMTEILFMNLAPTFIGGRDGRLAYESGDRCFNDSEMVSAFQAVADVAPYFPEGNSALSYTDSQQLFLQGQAAMWFGGSWDIPFFLSQEPPFEWSEFPVPAPDGKESAVSFHIDAGVGINAASENIAEAKVFLEWLAGDESAVLLASELPGFFPIQVSPPALDDPHAANFLSWNADRDTDVRFSWPVLDQNTPDAYTLIQAGTVGIVNGNTTPTEAADALQAGLAEWYEPAQSCSS